MWYVPTFNRFSTWENLLKVLKSIFMAQPQYIYQDSKVLVPVSTLLNWLRLVYGPFGSYNMHHTPDCCPDQSEGIECKKGKE